MVYVSSNETYILYVLCLIYFLLANNYLKHLTVNKDKVLVR